MKTYKFFGMLLASIFSLTAVAGLAACGGDDHSHIDQNKDDKCDVCGIKMPELNEDWEGTVYTIVGAGSGLLFENDWDVETDDPARTFAATSSGGKEIHTLTIDLYEGDAFQIIHDHGWDGQICYKNVANGGKDANGNAVFVESTSINPSLSDIVVGEGQSGQYELTLTIEKGSSPLLTFEKKQAFTDLVLLKLVDVDGVSPCFSENFLKHAILRERGGIYYKRGANVPAAPYIPATTPDMMKFGGWMKSDGTIWQGGALTEDMTLQLKYVEDDNPGFYADKQGSKYYLVGESATEGSSLYNNNWSKVPALELKRVESYAQHNVYELKNVVLRGGDKFRIAYGTNELSKGTWVDLSSPVSVEGDQAVLQDNQDSTYTIRIVVTADASGNVTEMKIGATWTNGLLNGYYLVGTYLDPAFGAAADDPYNSRTQFFWEASAGVFFTDIIVSDGTLATGKNYAEFLIKWYQTDGNGKTYTAERSGGPALEKTTPRIQLAPGAWRLTINTNDMTITWEKPAT